MGGKRSWRRLRAGHAWLKEAKRCRDNGRCPRPSNPCLLVARSHRLERALKVYGIGVKAQSGSRPSRGQRKGWMIGGKREGQPSGVVMASEIKMKMSMTPKHVFITWSSLSSMLPCLSILDQLRPHVHLHPLERTETSSGQINLP